MGPSICINSPSISDVREQDRPSPALVAPISIFMNKHLDRILVLASAEDEFCAKDAFHDRAKVARVTSQVCQRWRYTALNTPSIWIGPELSWYSHPSWLAIVLERSKPLPFDAFIPYDAVMRNPRLSQVILQHVPRIRHLNLTLRPPLWQSIVVSGLLQQQAPCLQTFSLTIAVGVDSRRQAQAPEQDNLFGDWAPLLRHLRVQNYPMNLVPKMYSGLRVLYFDLSHLTSPIQLLGALRNMKQLENLYLARTAGDSDLIIDIPEVSPVDLLNLNELQISDSIYMCTGIAKHLVLPHSSSIQLCCYRTCIGQPPSELDVNTALGEILSWLRVGLMNWGCEALTGRQSLHLGISYIKFAMEGPEEDGLSNREHPYISLALYWQPSPGSLQTLHSVFSPVASAFRHCSTPPDSLRVHADTKIPAELRPPVAKWLRKMKDIQAIEFQTHEAFAFLEPLLRPPRYSSDGDDECDNDFEHLSEADILLPFLGDLTFVNINFTTDKRRYWKRLMKTLKRRDLANCPIQQIDFVKCLGEFNVVEASRYVSEVKKDGEYYNDSDEDEADSDDSDYTIQANSDLE